MKAKRKTDYPRVYPRKDKPGHYYVDCGRIEGKRVRYSRNTMAGADLLAEQLRARKNKIGMDAIKLNADDLKDAVRAFEVGEGRYTLAEAMGIAMEHSEGEGGAITITELFHAYLEDRKQAGRAPSTLKEIRSRLGRFKDAFGDQMSHDVSRGELQRWIDQTATSPSEQDRFRVHLYGMFKFCQQHEHIRTNPAEGLRRVKLRRDRRPQILSIPDARNLMNTAQEICSAMIPYFSLALFAGVRPTEIHRLEWKDINLDCGEVFISELVSKTPYERYTKIEPNCIEWLLPHRKRSGSIHYVRSQFDLIRQRSGVEWGNDICRHSYATYHLAMYQNSNVTAEQLGHAGSTRVLYNHYRRAARQQDGERFFEIKPAIKISSIDDEKLA